MVNRFNDAPTPEAQESEVELFSAGELVGLIAYAGPGSRLKVRAHAVGSDQTRVGITTWSSDMAGGGPAVRIYRDPRDENFISALIPLGGHTVFIGPPRQSDQYTGTRVRPMIETGYPTVAHRMPIDPASEEGWKFELLPSDVITAEEQAAISLADEIGRTKS